MTKKKKIIILSCMIALLGVTAIFNFVLTATPTNNGAGAVVTTANYFTQYRSERVTNRNEELLQLDSVIASAEQGSAEHSEALTMKVELVEMTEKEMLLESLIKACGFEDVVVVIGLDSDSVNVITKSADLTTDDAIMIYTIIEEEMVASPENVKIIPIS